MPIGFVGVVVSFYGKEGIDTTGSDYKHGELVAQGCKGVLEKPLMPGKYAFNPKITKIKRYKTIITPTAISNPITYESIVFATSLSIIFVINVR